MARSISQIKQSITQQILNNGVLVELLNLDATLSWDEHLQQGLISRTSFINLMSAIIATSIWTLEVIFDDHKKETEILLRNQKVQRLKWYEQKALDFQYGHTLNDIFEGEKDYYDNINRTEDEVEEAKVVKKVSVNELPPTDDNDIQMKIAGMDNDGNLIQLSNDPATPYYDAFVAYVNKVKGAGIYIEIINRIADKLKLDLRVYYDPLILTSTGKQVSGGDSEPVRDAVADFLKTGIDFDGILILNELVDKLQNVEGALIPEITNAQYEDAEGGFLPLVTKRQPFSGYFTTAGTDADELIVEETEEGTWTKKGFLNILYIPNN